MIDLIELETIIGRRKHDKHPKAWNHWSIWCPWKLDSIDNEFWGLISSWSWSIPDHIHLRHKILDKTVQLCTGTINVDVS